MMCEAEEAIFAMVRNNENAYFDSKAPYTRDRSEISRDPYPIPNNGAERWVFGQLFVPKWYGANAMGPIIFQWHDTGDGSDAGGMPPPVSLIVNGSYQLQMQWVWSSSDPFVGGSFTANRKLCATIKPNRWYTIVMRTVIPTGYTGGEVDVWVDGTLANPDGLGYTYRGNLGTPNVVGCYWKAGVYRDTDTYPFAVVWKGLRDSASSLLSLKDTPAPNWVPLVPF
jgi:hypothetical protein